MPSRYPVEVRRQVVELARSGTRVAQLAETFGMTQASIYSWLKQDRVDRGEAPGLSTEGQMELAAAKRRIRQLETELAVSRKVNEVFLEQNLPVGCRNAIGDVNVVAQQRMPGRTRGPLQPLSQWRTLRAPHHPRVSLALGTMRSCWRCRPGSRSLP
jgi:transposase